MATSGFAPPTCGCADPIPAATRVKRYLLSRLVEALIAVWGIVTIVFFVTRLGGDPALLLLPTGASEAQLVELRTAWVSTSRCSRNT